MQTALAQALQAQIEILQTAYRQTFDVVNGGSIDGTILEQLKTITDTLQAEYGTTFSLAEAVQNKPIDAGILETLKLQNLILQTAHYTSFDIDGASANMPIDSGILEQLRLQMTILETAHYKSLGALDPNSRMDVGSAQSDMVGRINDLLQDVYSVRVDNPV